MVDISGDVADVRAFEKKLNAYNEVKASVFFGLTPDQAVEYIEKMATKDVVIIMLRLLIALRNEVYPNL